MRNLSKIHDRIHYKNFVRDITWMGKEKYDCENLFIYLNSRHCEFNSLFPQLTFPLKNNECYQSFSNIDNNMVYSLFDKEIIIYYFGKNIKTGDQIFIN